MKNRFLASFFLLFALSTSLYAGAVTPPLLYQTVPGGNPVLEPITAMNAGPGTLCYDPLTSNWYIKSSPRGDNSGYALTGDFIFSGTTSISGTSAGVAFTVANLPINPNGYVFKSSDLVVLSSSGVTASPAFYVRYITFSGTTQLTGTTVLSATTALTGTSGQYQSVAFNSPGSLILTTTNTAQVQIVISGTGSYTLEGFSRGYRLP